MLVLFHAGSGGEVKRKVGIVGKGLTFDSGGYNLKAGAGHSEAAANFVFLEAIMFWLPLTSLYHFIPSYVSLLANL